MKHNSRLQEKTKKIIIDAFWELYKTMPVEKITAAKIAERAHIHRSTFYRYFQDVYQILELIEENELRSVLAGIRQVKDISQLGITELSKVFLRLFMAHHEKIYYLLRMHDGHFKKQLEKNIKPLILSLLNPDIPQSRADYLCSLLLAVFIHNVTFLYEHSDMVSADILREYTADFMENGLLQFTVLK